MQTTSLSIIDVRSLKLRPPDLIRFARRDRQTRIDLMPRHLLHIGYPKAGSTFLQRWFEAHPQLAYVEGGLGGFRDVYSMARHAARSRETLLYRVTSAESLSTPLPDSGRPVIDYAQALSVAEAQQQVCSTLASLFPNAEVLIVTRGFRSMILSSLSQYARSGGTADLESLLLTKLKEPDPRFLETWDYDRLIAAYQGSFGAANVIVMPYELLRDDPRAFITTLSARLGVEPIEPSNDRVNESLSPVELYWYPRLTRTVRRIPSNRLFQAYVGAALRNRLRLPIALMQRLRPGRPFTAAAIPDDLVAAFRGRAESLRGNPLYEPYAADYLLDAS